MAVVITTYNHAHFLAESIGSVLAQSEVPREIVVVDDGSTDDPASVVSQFPVVRLIRQSNQGLAGARNTGLAAIEADTVAFLDADDRLLPCAIAAGVDCFQRSPDAGFVYGGHRVIDDAGRAISADRFVPAGPDGAYRDFLTGNTIGMHAAVLYDTRRLREAGGFDTTLRRCEDYDVYFRMSSTRGVASHPAIVAEYRWHGANMSSNHREMLRWVLLVLDRQRQRAFQKSETADDWRRGQQNWRQYYAGQLINDAKWEWRWGSAPRALIRLRDAFTMSPRFTSGLGLRMIRSGLKRMLPDAVLQRVRRGATTGPRVGAVDLGDLDRVSPISSNFGFDRGTPIDRYYIEGFLQRHASDIRGRCLEIGDDAYCRRFGGGRITRQDVLHVSPDAPAATIVGDLATPGILPDGAFDCLVITQTLHLIFDMRAAVLELHRALKHDGVLLLTVPGISQIDRGEWNATWFWSLTRQSAVRLFSEVFGAANVHVEQYGNVFAATAFLQGLAVEEVDRSKLDVLDESYPVTLAVRARRAAPIPG